MQTIADITWADRPLTEFLVLPLEGQDIEDAHEGDLFEELDAEHKALGVAWLWDHERSSVVAAVFEPNQWSKAQAELWLHEIIDAEAATSEDAAAQAAGSPHGDRQVVGGESAGNVQRQHLSSAPQPASFHYFRKALALFKPLMDADTYEQVLRLARASAGGQLKGTKTDADAPFADATTADQQDLSLEEAGVPQDNQEAALGLDRLALSVSNVKANGAAYLHKNKEWIWKRACREGTVYNPFSGVQVTVTKTILQSVVDSFGKAYEGVDIPAQHSFDAPLLNTGWVREVELRDSDGVLELWAALDFTEPEVRDKVLRGTIGNVSVGIEANVIDQNDGVTMYPWALAHIALTNKPLMTRLGMFSAAEDRRVTLLMAADTTSKESSNMPYNVGDPVTVAGQESNGQQYTIAEARPGVDVYSLKAQDGATVRWFLEEELTAAGAPAEGGEQAPPKKLSIEDASDDQVAMQFSARFGISLEDAKQAQIQLSQLRETNREQRVTNIVHALEGRIEVEGITQIAGYRHYPAVIEASVAALKAQPQALNLSVALDGTCPSLDTVVLSILNAIPEDGRYKVEASVVVDEQKPRAEEVSLIDQVSLLLAELKGAQ